MKSEMSLIFELARLHEASNRYAQSALKSHVGPGAHVFPFEVLPLTSCPGPRPKLKLCADQVDDSVIHNTREEASCELASGYLCRA